LVLIFWAATVVNGLDVANGIREGVQDTGDAVAGNNEVAERVVAGREPKVVVGKVEKVADGKVAEEAKEAAKEGAAKEGAAKEGAS
jgi:hypothetical protein